MSSFPALQSTPGRSARALDGKIILPEHGAWDLARQAWNLAVDQQPAAVVFPESVDDVVAAVRFAQDHGLRVAGQTTGHNADPLGDLAGTILVKTERMRAVQVDPVARVARVEAGVVWLEVVEAAAAHGLATLAGSSPDVGVVGYTLGGGLSFLGRKYGLSSNNVAAIELVTATGRAVRADRENEPDLFWALRGGGGNFGVVTAIELQLVPLTEVYAGILWWPIERAAEVLQAWRELTTAELPDELTTVGRLLSLPPIPEIPEELRGRSFAIVEVIHSGDPAQADELLAPLRALGPVNDTVAKMPMTELIHLHMDPEHPVPGLADGAMLEELPVAAIERLVDVAGAGSEFPLLSVELRHLEGELGRARPENGALASIEASYAMFAVGMVPFAQLAQPTQAQIEVVKGAVAPWAARHMYLNFAETRRDSGTFWSEAAHHRLRRIKAEVDPTQLFHANHQLTPAPTRS